MERRSYASLHNHTEYSNLKLIDSINTNASLLTYGWKIGLNAVAITDHDSVSGHLKAIEFYEKFVQEKYKEVMGTGEDAAPSVSECGKALNFKLILGNEIYLTEEGLCEANMIGKKFYHLILLAKDKEGHKQLRQLSSRAWSRAWFRAILRTPTYPSDLFDIVGQNKGHLVCSTACLGGYTAWCFQQMKENPSEAATYKSKLDNFLVQMEDLFGKGNFYLEIQPNDGDDQISYNKFLIENYWGKYPFIYTTDSHYLKKEDRNVHKAFLNSKSSNDREVDEFYSSAYMMSQEEVEDYFKSYIDAAKIEEMRLNSLRIADMCEYYTLYHDQAVTKVPYENIEDQTEIFDIDEEDYPYIYKFLNSDNETDSYFIKLIAKGFCEKYDDSWNFDEYYKRLEEELWTIDEISKTLGKPLADYFISMHKMINIMWEEADTIVGPSRGSAGALLINYLLGITQMNPLKQELIMPVWRFLHPSRPDLPDIDIDTESSKRVKVFNRVQDYFQSLGGNLVNICTFGTEGTKSALKTSARGLGIDDDVVTYLTSMIPNERGFDWTLSQCYYGDDDHPAIKAFKEEIDKYPQLWELATTIEGLVTRLGVHASGVVAVNTDFTEYNSYMKTSKEQIVSAFDLHDSEKMGLIKYDFLTVSALDRIHQTINYLLEDHVIEWQGNLRATFSHYFAPDVLDYTSEGMWDLVDKGGVNSLFQFDTVVGSQAIVRIKPRSVTQMAVASSVMRLMGDGELPLEVYAKYKSNINEWYKELYNYNLTPEEIKTLEKHLLKLSGVADSQESVMMLVMDPKISNFDMKEANKLRKTIAKKQFKEIEAVKELFFEKGRANGASQNILSYIWYVQISRQLGYSFSSIHTTGYALVALIEANLAYHYPIIYWNTACLSIDASAISEEDFYNLLDEGVLDVSSDEDVREANKMDYAKVASAIDKFKSLITIKSPDINKSRLSFTPNVEENSILYGLKGITRVTTPVIQEIMMNRPYSSLEDFVNKVTKRIVTKDKIINLIKSGAFNEIEGKSTREILNDFISSICDFKKKLTLQNANMLIDYGLIPYDKYGTEIEVYKLTKELRKHRDANKFYYIASEIQVTDDKKALWVPLIIDRVKEMIIAGEQVKVIDSSSWDKYVYDTNMGHIKTFIAANHDDLLKKLNFMLFKEEFDKYALGDELQWELDSINFYKSGHPLTNVIPQLPMEITPLNEIIEDAQEGFFYIKGKNIPKMRIYAIAGTVIDKDKVKGIVSVQTPEGIIDVKVYKDLFATMVNVISNVDEQGNKVIIEDSFFEKGTHLLIHGIKRGVTFIPKVYKNTGYKSIMKIDIDENGILLGLKEKSNA